MLFKSRSRHAIAAAAFILSIAAAPLIAPSAHAQAGTARRKVGQTPEPGAEATVTIGSSLLERYNMIVNPGVRIAQNVDVDLGMQGTIRISAGQPMKITMDDKQLRACTVAQDTYTNSMHQTGAACMTDRDKDGKFDTASSQDIGFTTKRLAEPVPYTLEDVPENAVSGTNQRVALVYLGAAAGVLRLSYREFTNDTARPAFTDDLSFPLTGKYPQTITWRDTRITLLGMTDDGLRYRVEPAK